MVDWKLTEADLKKYPHFDGHVTPEDAEQLATNPKLVAQHAFFPFIKFTQRWTKFAKKGERGDIKERPIRYAARRDAYIFSYYRSVLSDLYEHELGRLELNGSILAYRRIPDLSGGKCNIHFARDAFQAIKNLENCCVISLDISSYFESLDHEKIKEIWCRLLGVDRLPADHFQVYKAITKYSIVTKEEVYKRLGHFGIKGYANNGNPIYGYTTKKKKVPTHLCTGNEFRQKIAGGDGQPSLIKTNYKNYGIPQGAPISDLVANFYLVDFDKIVYDDVKDQNGYYYRYSDDILIVLPCSAEAALKYAEKIRTLIGEFGEKLTIKDSKTRIVQFSKSKYGQNYTPILPAQDIGGIEYLGFRFDGQRVYIRNSTISNLYRKVTRAARRQAIAHTKRYPDKNLTKLEELFNYNYFVQQFGRVEEFGELNNDYRRWTFWTYAKRASELMAHLGSRIHIQLQDHRKHIIAIADRELAKAAARRDAEAK